MQRDNYLFIQSDLGSVLGGHENKMYQEIDSIEGNRLLNTNTEEWCDYFEQEYKVNVINLKENEITVDQVETKVDVRQGRNGFIYDRSRPFYLTGLR